MIAKASTAGGAGDGKSASGVALTRKTAAELGDVKADAALKAVRDPMGAFNWFLCDSEFAFINAGSLSVPEMQKWLKADQVCFGLLRMGFGSGRFRRTKWVYIVWSGPSVGPVKRAKAASARGAMKAKLGPSSCDIEATCAEDASLEAIIDKVRRATAVDGDEVSTADGDPFSVDKFMEALSEWIMCRCAVPWWQCCLAAAPLLQSRVFPLPVHRISIAVLMMLCCALCLHLSLCRGGGGGLRRLLRGQRPGGGRGLLRHHQVRRDADQGAAHGGPRHQLGRLHRQRVSVRGRGRTIVNVPVSCSCAGAATAAAPAAPPVINRVVSSPSSTPSLLPRRIESLCICCEL